MKLTYQKSTNSQAVKDTMIKTYKSGSYEYRDALTGEVIDPHKMLTKQDLFALKTSNIAQDFEIRNRGDFEYDHLILELDEKDDALAQRYKDIVLESLTHPNYTWTKDGQDKDVKGIKQAYYDYHKKPDGTAHIHIYLNMWSTEKKDGFTNVYAGVSADKASIREQIQDQINKNILNEFGNGSDLVAFTSSKADVTKKQTSEETKSVVREMIKNPDFDMAEFVKKEPVLVSQSILTDILVNEERQLQELAQRMEEKKQAIARMKQFEVVNTENISLKEANAQLFATNEELKKSVEETKEQITILVENQKEEVKEFERKEEQLSNSIASLNDKVHTLSEDNEGKKKEIDELFSLNEQAQAEIEEKEKSLLAKEKQIADKDELLTSKEKQIAIQIGQIERQEQALKAIEENNKLLAEQVSSIKKQLQEEKEQADKKLAEKQKQFDDRIKAVEESNKALKEQNEQVIKENNVFRELAVMAIDKYKEATSLIKSLGTKLKTVAEKKLISNAVKEQSEFAKAVEQVDKEKVDIEAQIAKVKELFAKGKQKAATSEIEQAPTSKVKPK